MMVTILAAVTCHQGTAAGWVWCSRHDMWWCLITGQPDTWSITITYHSKVCWSDCLACKAVLCASRAWLVQADPAVACRFWKPGHTKSHLCTRPRFSLGVVGGMV